MADTRPIRIANTYTDIDVVEPSRSTAHYQDVTWSVDKDTSALMIHDREGRRIVQYNPNAWLKVVVI